MKLILSILKKNYDSYNLGVHFLKAARSPLVKVK